MSSCRAAAAAQHAYSLNVGNLWKFAVVALVALLFVVLPGGGASLAFFGTLLSVIFFVAIAFFGYRLYRENQFTLNSLDTRQRVVLYGSVGLAFLTFTATPMLFAGIGILVWLSLLALCSYGVYWVLVTSRRLD